MNEYQQRITYEKVPTPEKLGSSEPVDLTDKTMKEHLNKIIERMKSEGYDAILVYGDREHGTNFGYLTGFEPRFEESLLVLYPDETAYLLLGNESLRMAQYSRIPVTPIHVPYFSLPNQPMENSISFLELLRSSGLNNGMKIGIAGWKMFTSGLEDNGQLFCVPYFIVEGTRQIAGDKGMVKNCTDIFIHPQNGARATVNANEIAHYEFGAALASDGMLEMLNHMEEGKLETELASYMAALGQPHSVQTICAVGDRFTNAVVAPRAKKVKVGDKFSSTVGFRGGLTSRSGYCVHSGDELPPEVADYLERVAIPYYSAAVGWYENIRIGMAGQELYNQIEAIAPKKEYGWHLNPGHLTAGEEWMSSPIYNGSDLVIQNGMLFQNDIILSVPGYGGAGAEDGIALADDKLQEELKKEYPSVWERMQKRRTYMKETLGIKLGEELLPLSDLAGYMRPYLLNKDYAFKVK